MIDLTNIRSEIFVVPSTTCVLNDLFISADEKNRLTSFYKELVPNFDPAQTLLLHTWFTVGAGTEEETISEREIEERTEGYSGWYSVNGHDHGIIHYCEGVVDDVWSTDIFYMPVSFLHGLKEGQSTLINLPVYQYTLDENDEPTRDSETEETMSLSFTPHQLGSRYKHLGTFEEAVDYCLAMTVSIQAKYGE